jgi:copper(I)-binding protein
MNSIKRLALSLSTALALTFSLMVNVAADGIADKILVNDPYVRAVPPVVKTSAAFMQFQNSDEVEQFLVSASTPAAAAVELHMHTMDDGVMRMRQIAHIHLPPKQTVALQPGGLHIMLFDLTAPLNLGDRVPITLTFEDGSTKQISAEVRSVKQMMKH